MARRLIVNADDLGLHPAIDAGIRDCALAGALSSVSALAAGENLVAALESLKATEVGIGAHLCATTGLAPVATLRWIPTLQRAGRFRPGWRHFAQDWLLGRIRPQKLEFEFRAQLERLDALGVAVDHLDTHQHLHVLPGVADIVDRLAVERSLPVRAPARDSTLPWSALGPKVKELALEVFPTRARNARYVRAVGVGRSGWLDLEGVRRITACLGEEPIELMCHPGREPGVVPADPAWRYGWSLERAALLEPALVAERQAAGVTLIRYGVLSPSTARSGDDLKP